MTDALGNVTSYALDHDGRVTSQTDPVPATGVAAPVTNYAYNADSQDANKGTGKASVKAGGE